MHVLLETERLLLRRFTADDVDALVALDSDPRVRRYVEDGEPVTREVAADAITHWLGYHDRFEHFGFWAAIERESSAFIGWFHLRPSDDDHLDAPELGYRLVASAWSRGYGTEGSRALIDLAFTATPATRVVADCGEVFGVTSDVSTHKGGLRACLDQRMQGVDEAVEAGADQVTGRVDREALRDEDVLEDAGAERRQLRAVAAKLRHACIRVVERS